jgi:hypothetical protein
VSGEEIAEGNAAKVRITFDDAPTAVALTGSMIAGTSVVTC